MSPTRPSGGVAEPRVLVIGDPDWVDRVDEALDSDFCDTVLATSSAGALERLTEGVSFDCVVTAAAYHGSGASAFVASVRSDHPEMPVILWDEAGDPRLASDVTAAGATEYVVPKGEDGVSSELIDALVRSFDLSHRRRSLRRRARQFEALFSDPETYTWELEPDGRVIRANEPARNLNGAERGKSDDEQFWTLDWIADSPEQSQQLRTAVERARDGEPVRFDVMLDTDADQLILDVSVKRVMNGDGAVVSIVVEGHDITERAELERDLRASEELHRVTLNNMTDTILITDDDGQFTYVCPNVHFIFGYSVEEILEFGTIDALLGEELYDPTELEETGTLTNIECNATDKAGREHTLLVNVRQVSIQGGTVLYSCRDVTKRKQREQALAALHRTARKLLYAETGREIANVVVDDATEALPLPGVAVYLFDREENILRPAGYTSDLETLHGPLPTLGTSEQSIVGRAFVEGRTETFADVHDSDALANPATDVRSAIVIPLGEHGVLVAGASESGIVDGVTRELADLLAATAEAALDRVERESALRDRDRELQQQNLRLTNLNHVNEIIRRIDRALVRAETREEIEHAVSKELTTTDRFAFAWIGEPELPDETVRPRAWSGIEEGYLDEVANELRDGDEPAVRAATVGEPVHVSNVANALREEPWRKTALLRDFQSVYSVPLTHDDLSYGVLSVYADRLDAFDETTRAVLVELAETIASAIGSVERKRALLSDTVVELEYDVADPKCVFLRLARTADCEIELEGGVQQSADGVVAFASVSGAPVSRVIEAAERSTAIDRTREIHGDDDGGLVQLHISGPFVASVLVEHGAVLRGLRATPSVARVSIDVPAAVDVRTVDDAFTGAYPDSEIRARREHQRSIGSEGEFHARYLASLTERQLEVIQAAYHGGYFDTPRRSTGEEIAAALGISSTAFYQHVRKIQGKLFADFFEEPVPPATGDTVV